MVTFNICGAEGNEPDRRAVLVIAEKPSGVEISDDLWRSPAQYFINISLPPPPHTLPVEQLRQLQISLDMTEQDDDFLLN